MKSKKVSIRISLVALLTILILATSLTILSVSATFYRNSINWVIETLSRKVTDHVMDKIQADKTKIYSPEYLRKAIDGVEVSPNGKIFVLNDKYTIMASSERKNGEILPDAYANKKIFIGKMEDGLLAESFLKFEKNEKKKDRKLFKRKFDHFDYWHKYRKYIAIYEPLAMGNGKEGYVAIIIPYRDYFSSFTRNNIVLYGLAAFFVILTIFIAMKLSRKISEPLVELAAATEKIRDFELEPSPHIGSIMKEVDDMSVAIDNMRSGLRSFKKYVPSDLVKELISLNKEASLGGEKKNLTVFFSDIAGFTTISEKLPPEVLVEFLGEYLGEMSQIIMDNKGTVDKYIGDAVMAFWGAPVEFPDHALQGAKAALAYQKRLKELSAIWTSQGKPDFYSRIGLNTGDIIVGNMGYEKRMNYTVIGDAVNLASRLEGINKTYGTTIILGENTYNDVKNQMETRFLDIVAVKGKSKGIKIYELISEKGQLDDQRGSHREIYEKALKQYLERNFKDAKAGFTKAKTILKDDLASDVFIQRCDDFINNPPDKDWTGMYVAKTK